MIIHIGYAINTENKKLIVACYHDSPILVKFAIQFCQNKLPIPSAIVKPTLFSIKTEFEDLILFEKKPIRSASEDFLMGFLLSINSELNRGDFSEVVFLGDVNLTRQEGAISQIFRSQIIQNHFLDKRVVFVLQSGNIETVNEARKHLSDIEPYDYSVPLSGNIWIVPKGIWPSDFMTADNLRMDSSTIGDEGPQIIRSAAVIASASCASSLFSSSDTSVHSDMGTASYDGLFDKQLRYTPNP